MTMDIIYIVFSLTLPVVHCPITSVTTSNRKPDLDSITDHITLLEHQVTTLQFEFESELKSTLSQLINVKNELKASHEEQIALRNGLREKCRMLKLTATELNTTKSEIVRLRNDVNDVKVTCSANTQSLLNVTEIVGAINSTVEYHVELSNTQKFVKDKDILKFDKTRTNKGGYYDEDTGIFKVPRQGSYMIWANIHLTEANSFINIFAHKENTTIAYGHTETAAETTGRIATILSVTSLHPGERVWFTKDSGSNLVHGTNTSIYTSSYGGVLLRPL